MNDDAGDETAIVSANTESQRRNSEEVSEGKVLILEEVAKTVGVILNKPNEVVKSPNKKYMRERDIVYSKSRNKLQ